MCKPWCARGSQGTTLGVVLTFHFISGQSLFVICHWDVEARLGSLQAPGNSPVCLPSHDRSTEVTDVHCGPAVHTCTAVQPYMGSRDLNSGPCVCRGKCLMSPKTLVLSESVLLVLGSYTA